MGECSLFPQHLDFFKLLKIRRKTWDWECVLLNIIFDKWLDSEYVRMNPTVRKESFPLKIEQRFLNKTTLHKRYKDIQLVNKHVGKQCTWAVSSVHTYCKIKGYEEVMGTRGSCSLYMLSMRMQHVFSLQEKKNYLAGVCCCSCCFKFNLHLCFKCTTFYSWVSIRHK